jgi:protein TonB
MKLKNVLAIVGLVFVGAVNAQEGGVPVPPPPPKPVVAAEVVDFPDVEAEFPGGINAMKKFIGDNVQYPIGAIEQGIEGNVYVTFVVEKDGAITGINIMRGTESPELNKEAIRLIESMPKWKPGEVKNTPVRCRLRLPISFTLDKLKKEDKK